MEKLLNFNNHAKNLFSAVDLHTFNIFSVKEATKENELVSTVTYIFAKENLFDKLAIKNEKFVACVRKLQQSYKPITYHNKTHAADLAQNFYYLCSYGELKQKCQLDSYDMMIYILAAACHDLGHPGYNNIFLIEKKDCIAIRYNDISVLENYHIASSFDIISKAEFNIFEEMSNDEVKRVRKQMIGAVLATDMTFHFAKIGILKGKFSSSDIDPTSDSEKRFICEQLFHLCDIANSTKDFPVCEKWINLLFNEFF